MIYKQRYGRYGVMDTALNGYHDFLWNDKQRYINYDHIFERSATGLSEAQKRMYEEAYGALGASQEGLKDQLARARTEAMELAKKNKTYLMYGGGALVAYVLWSRYSGARKNPGEVFGAKYSSKGGLEAEFSAANYMRFLAGGSAAVVGGAVVFGPALGLTVAPVPGARVAAVPVATAGIALMYAGLRIFGIKPVQAVTGTVLEELPGAAYRRLTS